MPTFRHGKNTKVYLASNDVSPYFNNAQMGTTVGTGEVTGFGAGGKSFVVGLVDGKMTLGGMFDGTANAIDSILSGVVGIDDQVITYMPEGGVLGRRCYVGYGDLTNYGITTPVADVVSIQAEFNADLGFWSGVILGVDVSVATATTTNNASVDNGALTSNGGVATLHVTANAQTGSTTVKVQHSVDNSVWVDLATHTVVATTVKTAERLTVAPGTTVNRYLRTQIITAGTGAVVCSTAFARR